MGAPEVIEGLLEERRGYVVHGKMGRVAEVDEVLATFGISVADDGNPITDDEGPTGSDLETTDGAPPKKRAAKRAAAKAKTVKKSAAKPPVEPADAKPAVVETTAGGDAPASSE